MRYSNSQGSLMALRRATLALAGASRLGLVVPGVLFFCAIAVAQAPPMGPEFQVNTYTTAWQFHPVVASDSAGNFVVVWNSNGQDGSYNGIFGRRYDSSGAPQGGEFPVNVFTTGPQSLPDIAMDAAGNFVVAWMKDGGDEYQGVLARRFDSSANPVSGEIPVTSQGRAPRVAMNGAGAFVVSWQYHVANYQDWNVRARLYDSGGNPQGSEFQVNTYTTGEQYQPSVSMSSTGDFLVLWTDSGPSQTAGRDGSGKGVYAQRFDGSGGMQGADFLVNTSTTGDQSDAEAAIDAAGNFVVAWRGEDGSYSGVKAQHFDASANQLGSEFQVNTYTTGNQYGPDLAMVANGDFIVTWWGEGPQNFSLSAQRFHADGSRRGGVFDPDPLFAAQVSPASVAINAAGRFVVAWTDWDAPGNMGIAARIGGFPDAKPMSVDERAASASRELSAPAVSNENGVLEVGERVAVDTAWANPSTSDLPLTGSASSFTGPAGPGYAIPDAAADYGTILAGSSADCLTAASNCYEVELSGARSPGHFDATFDEALSTGVAKTWTLHLGESFPDVPVANPFYGFIENIFHNGITGGCGGGNYCPATSVNRAQMAVFLLKSEHGSTYLPPPCTGVFGDVPCPSVFANWIEQLAAEGITGGCGGGNYCPNNPVTRAQMAVFLLKAEHGSAYVPPGCTGVFGDVPCPSLFANWIEQLAAEGITGGCGGGNYCPNNPNNRGQMAAFLVKIFGLELYGP
jgi:hypothetical protein